MGDSVVVQAKGWVHSARIVCWNCAVMAVDVLWAGGVEGVGWVTVLP